MICRGPMFVVGKGVKGGLFGQHPSLTDLDDGNLRMTTDFRRVYATMIDEWLGCNDTQAILKGRFEPLGVFAQLEHVAELTAEDAEDAEEPNFTLRSWRPRR